MTMAASGPTLPEWNIQPGETWTARFTSSLGSLSVALK